MDAYAKRTGRDATFAIGDADAILVSGGRFLFGVGNGWNEDEMANHGTAFASRHKLARERVEAMKVIWTESKAEYHGEFVNFEPMMAWPKPVQKPHPPIIVGGAFPYGARRALRYGNGWMPHRSRTQYADVQALLPKFREMAAEAGRDPASVPITIWGSGRTSTCSSATATTASHAW
jgi:alkanesulfonate monooxygenase SsuD/methylene tetrahydromethanopterin reductase-like flavin-dependent oxidoreductase (luciferase family)